MFHLPTDEMTFLLEFVSTMTLVASAFLLSA
jgi:hypothetical protein